MVTWASGGSWAERAHQLRAADERAERQAAAERLREHEQIGHDAPVLVGEQPAGAAEAGDHLVEDQQRADLVAAPPQRGEEVPARDAHAALGLHRLDDHRRGALVDARERADVVEGQEVDAGQQRLERPRDRPGCRPTESAPQVSPWKPPSKATKRGRPVALRAVLSAPSTASAPLDVKYDHRRAPAAAGAASRAGEPHLRLLHELAVDHDVEVALRLRAHRGHDLGMGVADVGDPHAGEQVEVLAPLDVAHRRAAGARPPRAPSGRRTSGRRDAGRGRAGRPSRGSTSSCGLRRQAEQRAERRALAARPRQRRALHGPGAHTRDTPSRRSASTSSAAPADADALDACPAQFGVASEPSGWTQTVRRPGPGREARVAVDQHGAAGAGEHGGAGPFRLGDGRRGARRAPPPSSGPGGSVRRARRAPRPDARRTRRASPSTYTATRRQTAALVVQRDVPRDPSASRVGVRASVAAIDDAGALAVCDHPAEAGAGERSDGRVVPGGDDDVGRARARVRSAIGVAAGPVRR